MAAGREGTAMLLIAAIAALGIATVWALSELQDYAERTVARKHQND